MLDWLTRPAATLSESERRQSQLLAWILLFTILFSVIVFFAVLFLNPNHDPNRVDYDVLISGLVIFLSIAYGLNRVGHYKVSAVLMVASSVIAPWSSRLFDRTILRGDFVPLVYFTFSVLLSSMLLSTMITSILALFQFAGLALVLILSSATSSFNWFSLLAYVFLTSTFSILANGIIQGNMKQIDAQKQELARDEAIMREQAIRDELTCLYNRRYMVEALKREIQRAERNHSSLGIIMLDMDHFKRVNDTRGHAAGDAVLQEVSTFMFGHIRQYDIACRYGGDEFVLVLPETTLQPAMERALHLRDGLKALNLPEDVTLSMGIAIYPDHGADIESLLTSADNALYQAKHDGGNCVRVAD